MILGIFGLVLLEPLIVGLFQKKGLKWWWAKVPYPVRGLVYAGSILLVVVLGGAHSEVHPL